MRKACREGFLDIVDGLRTVDEAVHFLNLQCGDRIGHGTVLGTNVRKWHQFKLNTIVLPRQDCLDNVADIYFSKIYGHSMQNGNTIYSIHSYCEAWKLCGDEPELYMKEKKG